MSEVRGRVLILAYAYPPNNLAGAVRPARFVKYLVGFGYPASVITATPQPGNGSGIVYVPDYLPPWMLRFWRLVPEFEFTWVGAATRAAVELASREPFDVVLSTSPPVASHLAGYRIKRTCGVKWVADFRDPLYAPGSPRYYARKVMYPPLERLTFRSADALIANTEPAAELWRRRYPRRSSKLDVIPNGFDPEEAMGAARPSPRSYRLMVHVGAVYVNRHPGPVLDALECIRKMADRNISQLRLRFIGVDPKEAPLYSNAYLDLVEQGVLEFLPRVSREEANQASAEADYLLLLDAVLRSESLQIPSKLFDYVRIGRPILAVTTAGSPTEGILRMSGVPHAILYWHSPADENARKLLDFLSLPTAVCPPSQWFLDHFDARLQARRLAAILDRVLGVGGIVRPGAELTRAL